MRTLRWVAFIPVAAIVSFLFAWVAAMYFDESSYHKGYFFPNVVGLAPSFAHRFIPIVVFVLIGTLLAPKRGPIQIVLLGILGGVFGWPFGPKFMSEASFPFYSAEAVGTVLGAVLGMLTAFKLSRMAEKK